ncbi:unnamed protein product [Closterium sp. Naga37s-1]|nr:unnamed protein product [Closterium sp. Naga37s-1]
MRSGVITGVGGGGRYPKNIPSFSSFSYPRCENHLLGGLSHVVVMPAEQTPQSPAVVRNGLSVLGVIPLPAETYSVPISPLPPPASPVRSVGIVYPFEPPSTPADWEPHPSIVLVPGGGEGSSRPSAGSPSTVNSTPGKRPRLGAKYTQQRLWGAPPPRKEASPQRPVATQDEAPAKTTGDVLYETIKHRFESEWKAASDAADAVPELYMVDDVIRGFADLISRSNVKYEKFHNIQHVFCKTNLEAQGIHTIRWLSRGEAVRRFLEILPAAIVVLKEYNNDLYEIATSFKFQWLLRLLADVLWELNHLNQRFQQRQIDVTLVSHLVDQTRMRMKNRYLNFSPDHQSGSGEKMTLNDFIQRHQKMDKREVKAEGVDSDGNPVKFSYTLHENPIEGQEPDGDVTACVELSLKFVRAVDKELEWRMNDLEELEGSLFSHLLLLYSVVTIGTLSYLLVWSLVL